MLYPWLIRYINDRRNYYHSRLSTELTELSTGAELSGKLYIIATPIGNLQDLSPRTKEALSESELLLVEDTRITAKLLYFLGIRKTMISCHKFNEASRRELVREASAKNQTLALVSDAGTPLISDPGQRIVEEAIENNMLVVPIPGPTALIQALVASGLDAERFCFEGFLKDKPGDLKRQLKALENESRTMIFYASPHGIRQRLSLMKEMLGSRRICLARELTKKFEEYIRTDLDNAEQYLVDERLRGEFTLVVEGASPASQEQPSSPAEQEEMRNLILAMLESDVSVKDIVSEIAHLFGEQSRGRIYKLVLALRKTEN